MATTTLTADPQTIVADWWRLCHAAYKQGDRTAVTVAGERDYQAWRKRVQRAS